MEKDSGFWFHQHHIHLPSPNPNLLGCLFDIGLLNNQPVCKNPYFVGDSTLRTLPLCPVPQLQPWKANEPNASSNWFDSMPQSNEAFSSVFNSSSNGKLSTGQVDLRGQACLTTSTALAQKRFLVFDQSGDKTTMIFSSGFESAARRETHWIPTPPATYNLNKVWPPGGVSHFRLITKDECGEEKSRDGMNDEMHEDTEELNALLYSDNDSDFSEDDEETSTGHSPSTMTNNGERDADEETGEEVDSSAAPSKRQKLLNGGFNVPSNIHATAFVKTSVVSAFEDDAESSSGICNKQSVDDNVSSSGGKSSRKERLHDTLSILQSIIPNVNGKDRDTIVVIDEAIHYLKSLKVQAMALGLDTP